MSRLRTRADAEAWLEAQGREYFVHEPTLRLPLTLADGCATTIEIHWRGAQGVEIFVPLAVTVPDDRSAAVDLLLAELNAELLDAGARRSGPGALVGLVVFPDHEGAVAAEILARALDAAQAAAERARPPIAAASGSD